jgi:hypothetical protein
VPVGANDPDEISSGPTRRLPAIEEGVAEDGQALSDLPDRGGGAVAEPARGARSAHRRWRARRVPGPAPDELPGLLVVALGARASQIQLAQPLLTLIWALLLMGETLTIAAPATALAVLACILVTQRAKT